MGRGRLRLGRRHARYQDGETPWQVSWFHRMTCSMADLVRSEEHTSELQSPCNLVCRLLLEKKKKTSRYKTPSNLIYRIMLNKNTEPSSIISTSISCIFIAA